MARTERPEAEVKLYLVAKENEELKAKLAAAERERDAERAHNAVLRGALELALKRPGMYPNGMGVTLVLSPDEWLKAQQALSATTSDSAERVMALVELLQDAVSETENGEKLSVGFCLAARKVLAKWGGE